MRVNREDFAYELSLVCHPEGRMRILTMLKMGCKREYLELKK
jgi:hypothetical protein